MYIQINRIRGVNKVSLKCQVTRKVNYFHGFCKLFFALFTCHTPHYPSLKHKKFGFFGIFKYFINFAVYE